MRNPDQYSQSRFPARLPRLQDICRSSAAVSRPCLDGFPRELKWNDAFAVDSKACESASPREQHGAEGIEVSPGAGDREPVGNPAKGLPAARPTPLTMRQPISWMQG